MQGKRHYKNLILFFLSLLFAIGLILYPPFHSLLIHLGRFGYVGAFLAGMLFASTFTVATGAAILFLLAETLSPIEIGLLAGAGAVLSDLIIFRFIRDSLLKEIIPIYNRLGGTHLNLILHTKYFSWTLPVIGAIFIASPLPDEIGISLMGIARMKTYQFLLLSFTLHAVGIFLVVSASLILKNDII